MGDRPSKALALARKDPDALLISCADSRGKKLAAPLVRDWGVVLHVAP